MKICVSVHTVNAGGGIQERRAILINEWIKKGYDITILCPVPPARMIDGIAKDVSITYLGKWPDRERYHVFLSVLPMVRFFKENRDIDVVLASAPSHSFVTALALILAKNNARLFSTIHGTVGYSGDVKQKIVSFVSRLFIRCIQKRVTRFGAVSKGVADELKKILSKRARDVRCIYNPVIVTGQSREFKRLERNKYASASQKIIVGVGRLHYQKGFDLLIKAFSLVQEDSVLILVGEGEEEASLRSLAVSLNIAHKVIFTGYQNNVRGFMELADCFVLSSRWEGFGNVVVEALYANAPIVSFNCPHGPLEILQNGKWGALVKLEDIDALACEIDKSLKNFSKRENRRWMDFTSSHIADEYLDFMGAAEKNVSIK